MNPIKHPLVMALLLCTATASLSACKKADDVAPVPAVESEAVPAEGSAHALVEKPARFDINSVPVSTVTLGDFPYIQLPDGYMPHSQQNIIIPFGQAPFWDGNAYVVKEGRLVSDRLTVRYPHPWSSLELRKNLEAAIKAAGGVLVSETSDEDFPWDTYRALDEQHDFQLGRGEPSGSYKSRTYVIRRQDREIWIDFGIDSSQGRWIVLETTPIAITAGLLPASEMKKQLDAAGKVALQVNFATDKTEVLPDSLPQIEQVAALLKDDDSLKLAVNGHTDDSGDVAHNQTLSEGRAKSVVALLTAKGIDAERLTAAGFGSTQPVADNGTEEGKARNRRVELVKR